MKESLDYQPSRLFIYYFARLLDGTLLASDAGITIRNGLQAIKRFGVPPENIWPYDITKFAIQPSKEAFVAAKASAEKVFDFYTVKQDLIYIKNAILAGFPVLLGIVAYDGLDAATTMQSGLIPLPNKTTEQKKGGHCISLWGWDDSSQTFLVMNTFGTSVGIAGWFKIPYSYVIDPDLAYDLYTIQYWK
jgi:C1A family cysteine protease